MLQPEALVSRRFGVLRDDERVLYREDVVNVGFLSHSLIKDI
jgi:hypothetical protein